MVQAACEIVLLADSTKCGDEKFARFASISEVSKLITDNSIPSSEVIALDGAGVEVIRN
jgi:DeoR family fructose operon transcriptional repressor